MKVEPRLFASIEQWPSGPWAVDVDLAADDSHVYVRIVDSVGNELAEITYSPPSSVHPTGEELAHALVDVVNDIRGRK